MILQTYEVDPVLCNRTFFITGGHILRQSAYLSCACQCDLSWGWLASQILLPYVT